MTGEKLRWGILSTAGIARKNWLAIRNTGEAVVTAVASRDRARSAQFIAECESEAPMGFPTAACGSYEELLSREDVDAVYIPLPTGLRKEWVIRAAAAGKHVVCEKPCAIRASDLREMTDACAKHGVQFMDGVMFMHSRRLSRLREVLDDGTSIGKLRRITFGFSFRGSEEFASGNIRVHSELEPQGCLGDLGWYCIRFSLWAQKWRRPVRVVARTLSESTRGDSPSRVPTEFSGELFFEDGVTSGFYCSFITGMQQWVVLSGEQGSVRISDFVLPHFGCELAIELNQPEYVVKGCQFEMEPRQRSLLVREHGNSHADSQESNLFREFGRQVRSGALNRDWPEIALMTQEVMDACQDSARRGGESIGLR